jgi:hypothetical protein
MFTLVHYGSEIRGALSSVAQGQPSYAASHVLSESELTMSNLNSINAQLNH